MRTSVVLAATLAAAAVTLPASVTAAAPEEGVSTCRGLVATLVGTDGADDFAGTPGPDVVVLGAGSDRFQGLGGDDVICGGPGADRIDGGDGNDVLVGEDGNDRIAGGADDDRIAGEGGRDTLIGGDGNDRVRGGAGNDYLREGAGDDFVSGDGGVDFVSYLRFLDGPVTVTVAQARVTGAGTDFVAAETIEGTPQGDLMTGSDGRDDLRGGGGPDVIRAGAGHDIVYVDGGRVSGGDGNDFIDARGTSRVSGDGGNDSIRLRAGAVRAGGGSGSDAFVIHSASSAAVIDGGSGTNLLSFSRFGRAVAVNVGENRARWSGGALRFDDITIVRGGRGNDTLVGSVAGDYLDGGRGNDVLRGLGGGDLLDGRRGYDRAIGGTGFDVCKAEARTTCER